MAEVKTLVVRKPCFGLPTGCPQCLSAYIYLNFAQIPFHLDFQLNNPHSVGDCVVYNNEREGIIDCLKKDAGVVDLDSEVSSLPEWISTKAILTTWLADALAYELWVGCEASSANSIYYSDLPWPLGKVLFWNKARWVKLKHGITNDNVEVKKEKIYEKANSAYDALSNCLGEQNYLFENRPSSLDAIFLAHGLVVIQALPECSILRIKFLEHGNLVRYVQRCKTELIEAAPSPSSGPQFHTDASSSASKSHSTWNSKPKNKTKREKTKEEKTFKRKAKYFVVAQLVAVVVFLTLMTTFDDTEVDVDDADGGYDYDE
ncbi:mitochondrial outer membrane import complex protein METAXIN-like isoform X2 [Abrus precatorius]|uniref:Mitochondrial outer membrane import complex protein METAXIN-like isoform X2 n=1 Tax=Abrus precatorius TaxID=3816 RepID=A0A8B8JNJ7_ABRPR|nr:mitochondrial outer membrane import complex protein METAXIN-like isoform X2 [Abrus precatorius]